MIEFILGVSFVFALGFCFLIYLTGKDAQITDEHKPPPAYKKRDIYDR